MTVVSVSQIFRQSVSDILGVRQLYTDFIYPCKPANDVRRENGWKDDSAGNFLVKVFCRI